jgi:hypothetical protein
VVMIVYDWSPRTPLAIILGAVALGCVLWGAAIITMRHPLVDELRFVVRQLRPAGRTS